MDEDALRAMLPMGFGAQSVQSHDARESESLGGSDDAGSLEEEVSGDETGQVWAETPAPFSAPAPRELQEACTSGPASNKHTEDEDEDDYGPEPDVLHANGISQEQANVAGPSHTADETDRLPLAEHIQLEGHTKSIASLAVDPAGARIATGSLDYDVKLWDFGGMTTSLRPFKSFEPAENYPVVDLSFAPQTKNLLCVCATTQPRVYDYDGDEIAKFRKGDVFMRDMRHTTGHVSEMTCGAWDPVDDTRFLTGGSDSTVRLWDMATTSQKAVVVVRSKERGTKTKVTAATYTSEAGAIVATGADGALYMWSTSGNYGRPSAMIQHAHSHGSGASSLASRDALLVSRGSDNTVKLWDIRQLRTPVAVRDVPNGSDQTNVSFSPDGRHILTGSASVPGGPDAPDTLHSSWGQVVMLERDSLSISLIHPVSRSSVIRTQWHPRLNQLFATTREGIAYVYFDRAVSRLGAILPLGKKARARKNLFAHISEDNLLADMPIFTEEDEQQPKKRHINRLRQDPKATRIPERPLHGQGRGGRIGRSQMQPLMLEMWESDLRAEDPREALLKYADKAEKDPKWTSVYAKTQPKPVFDKHTEEDS